MRLRQDDGRRRRRGVVHEAAADPDPHRSMVRLGWLCHPSARRSTSPRDIPFELGIEDLTVGDGAEATSGKKVSVHYVGVAFSSGEEFDASWNRDQPFEFKLGKGQVIPGWDAGVQGMKVGGRRKLTIPSAMAYGARGSGRRRDQAARAARVRRRPALCRLTVS